MGIIIKPRTQAECNQLASVLHSQGFTNAFMHTGISTITIGAAVLIWKTLGLYFITNQADHVFALIRETSSTVNVNAAYDLLAVYKEVFCAL